MPHLSVQVLWVSVHAILALDALSSLLETDCVIERYAVLTLAGIEWLNDTTLHLLFPTPSSALIGLTLLSKAGFDPSEGDDPLLERAAHSVPFSLLPMAEPEPVNSLAGSELMTDLAPTAGVKRKGRGAFGQNPFDLEPLVSTNDDITEFAAGVDPIARIAVRYATVGDAELRKEAKQSEWYKRHGNRAGKEVASTPRTGRRDDGDADLSWEGRGTGEGREFAKRIGRERRMEPYARGRRSEKDLDRELEGMKSGAMQGEDDTKAMEVDEEGGLRGRTGRRGGRAREVSGKEDLDRGKPFLKISGKNDQLIMSRAGRLICSGIGTT